MSEKITRVLLVDYSADYAIMMDKSLNEHKAEAIAHAHSSYEANPEYYESHPELKMVDIGYYARPLLESNPEFSIVGEYQTGKDALAACAELSPDVVLLCQPNDMSQFEFVEKLSKSYPEIGVAVARITWGAEEMRDMLLLGAMYMVDEPFQTPYIYRLLEYAKTNPPALVLRDFKEKGIL